MSIVLETSRLSLRQMTHDDLDFLATMLGDPEVMRHYPKCYSRDEARQWLDKQFGRYAREGHGFWLVIEKQTQAPVGQVGLLLQNVEGVDEREVGYMLHRPFWKQGFATEAARAVRDHAFANYECPRVISLVRPVNIPSQAVARRMGMSPLPKTVIYSGYEHFVFAILREQWVKAEHTTFLSAQSNSGGTLP
ncbi:MAG TPA: GNAT family N-acetyltransferase [Pirellulales bacterium]|jgi:RimJ/RimL family protein N-acetyltransferase|nr:GNAT family N-acetyltransferase [Pirellulales bacterium]